MTTGTKTKKTCNKHVFTWVFAFLLGDFAVDRFVRGQVAIGLAKIGTAVLGGMLFGMGIASSVLSLATLDSGFDVFKSIMTVSSPLVFIGIALCAAHEIWQIVDWIIAMVKSYGGAYGKEKDLSFDDEGKYTR